MTFLAAFTLIFVVSIACFIAGIWVGVTYINVVDPEEPNGEGQKEED